MTDYQTALDAFVKALPAYLEGKRPDLPPEVRELLVAMAQPVLNGWLSASINGDASALRLFSQVCGISPFPSVKAGGVSQGQSG